MILDDYFGNLLTVDFPYTKGEPSSMSYVTMFSKDKATLAKLEITQWPAYGEVTACIIPK